ncbi:pentapeptide repeat-containing protein [Micromonospora sp. R77]|uniref:pentapeptide repeat-containing protein n=1 Tax=Micromonospora sp. R77 TaxID=2925836 RepID=UPI001F604C00|nr:pentapeptide repeat-containing protein [Micromonospora sp. R77]MCI4063522.1 pentapeptide repeat-containing protein [Micromonospora sp. R77]
MERPWRTTRTREPDEATAVPGSLPWQVVGALLAAVLLAIGSSVSLWLLLGRPGLGPARTTLDPKDLYDGLRISLAVVAGLGGVIALVVAYQRQRVTEAQHALARSADRREATKLFGERFRSASEQLGSTEAAVRLAGVYAMLNLANDWPSGRQMCVDVLCGYLRMPFDLAATDPEIAYSRLYPKREAPQPAGGPGGGPPAAAGRKKRQELQVRLAIQRGLAAHLRDPSDDHDHDEEILDFWPEIRLDFYGATLCNADFEGCDVALLDLRRATLLGDAQFWQLRVRRKADFTGATFTGGALFSGAAFDGHASFVEVRFERKAAFNTVRFGNDGEFHRAVFGGDASFTRATFGGGAYFPEVRFAGTVSFRRSRAETGHRLDGAEVGSVKRRHVWPAGVEVVGGRLRRTA